MIANEVVITGIGVVAPNGIGKEAFWQALENGENAISEVSLFDTAKFPVKLAGEVKNFNAETYLEPKRLRNLDRNAIFLLTASKLALDDAKFSVTAENTDTVGVSTGTTFPHIWSIAEFDKEVFVEGLNFSNPAFFPMTVVNAASSHVSIYFNIQGFNTTLSTGYTSGLESIRYSLNNLKNKKADFILSSAVETISAPLFFGFHKLGYMAGIKGPALSCPFDKRRNGPIPAEAAVVLCVETPDAARARNAHIYAKIKSVASYFDACNMGKINPDGEGLEKSIRASLDASKTKPEDIDYISACANSSADLDHIEVKVLKKVFGKHLSKIPVSSIKSMIGETFSAASLLQAASAIGVMERGIIPPTLNYQQSDIDCDIDCVPNQARKKQVRTALVTSSGPGGYNSACILQKAN